MSAFPTDVGSFAVAAVASLAATPVAIRIAKRTNFLDRPRGYRKHKAATPFLGGAAVLAAFLLAGLLTAGASGRLLVVLGCAVGLWLLGTIDDRLAVSPRWRVLAEAGAASALFAAGLGWSTKLPGAADLAITIVWVVGVVNAFNLMDNLDGACSTVTVVAAAGIGAFAAIRGQVLFAALAFALMGAYAGFLPWNLARPARIFLGDGGSMLAGSLVAALAMAAASGTGGLLVGALLAGLPIFDSTLVSFSRTRRGVSFVTGGRDHLTHRLLLALHGPRAVATTLALLQAVLCGVAILGYEMGAVWVDALAFGVFLTGVAAILVLDTARWRPAGIAVESEVAVPQAPSPESVSVDSA